LRLDQVDERTSTRQQQGLMPEGSTVRRSAGKSRCALLGLACSARTCLHLLTTEVDSLQRRLCEYILLAKIESAVKERCRTRANPLECLVCRADLVVAVTLGFVTTLSQRMAWFRQALAFGWGHVPNDDSQIFKFHPIPQTRPPSSWSCRCVAMTPLGRDMGNLQVLDILWRASVTAISSAASSCQEPC